MQVVVAEGVGWSENGHWREKAGHPDFNRGHRLDLISVATAKSRSAAS
jgi:hypothetical protein